MKQHISRLTDTKANNQSCAAVKARKNAKSMTLAEYQKEKASSARLHIGWMCKTCMKAIDAALKSAEYDAAAAKGRAALCSTTELGKDAATLTRAAVCDWTLAGDVIIAHQILSNTFDASQFAFEVDADLSAITENQAGNVYAHIMAATDFTYDQALEAVNQLNEAQIEMLTAISNGTQAAPVAPVAAKPMKMKKVQSYKGFVIAEDADGFYSFLRDEWNQGDGFRSAEMEHGSIGEAQMFIDCYGSEDRLRGK